MTDFSNDDLADDRDEVTDWMNEIRAAEPPRTAALLPELCEQILALGMDDGPSEYVRAYNQAIATLELRVRFVDPARIGTLITELRGYTETGDTTQAQARRAAYRDVVNILDTATVGGPLGPIRAD